MQQKVRNRLFNDILNQQTHTHSSFKQKQHSQKIVRLPPISYKCQQIIGSKSKSQKYIDEDNITCLRYSQEGQILALGDKAGRLILFKNQTQKQKQELQYYHENQSYQPEKDKLKGNKISEEIKHIQFFRQQQKYIRLLTANQQTIKLWKLNQKNQKKIVRNSNQMLDMPCIQSYGSVPNLSLKQTYENTQSTQIKSMSLLKNQDYMMTAYNNKLLLWNLQYKTSPLILYEIDSRKSHSEKLIKQQKITCASLDSQRQHIFAVGTDKGSLRCIDIRQSLNNHSSLAFECKSEHDNFLSQISSQFSSVLFMSQNRIVAARDLISVKIWDSAAPKQPLFDIPLNQTIKQDICQIFQAQVYHDRFKMTASNQCILTGNYGDSFHQIDVKTGFNSQYQIDYEGQTRVRQVGNERRWNNFSCHDKVLNIDRNEKGDVAVSSRSCFLIFSQDL